MLAITAGAYAGIIILMLIGLGVAVFFLWAMFHAAGEAGRAIDKYIDSKKK